MVERRFDHRAVACDLEGMVAQRNRARPIVLALVLAYATLTLACSGSRGGTTSAPPTPGPPPAESLPKPRDQPVQIEMKNVRLHAADNIVLEVASLRGEMVSVDAGQPPVFDDPRSYRLHVFSAQIAMDMPSLTHLMNDYLFAYDGAPLDDITMEVDEGMLKQKGRLKKGVKIPISVKARVSASADGRLRLEMEKVSALGVPAKTLMELVGLELDDVVNLKRRRGIELSGNDIILSPGQVVPPPEIQGRLSAVSIAGGKLVQTFASNGAAPRPLPPAPDSRAANYIFFSGEAIRFGRLTMNPAHLQLIDIDQADWFDFFPARYERQLVAGYSKNIPGGGLKTYMPDLADLNRTRPAR